MGGTTSVNCFERWGRRGPDGPLIKNLSERFANASTTAGSSIYYDPGAPPGSSTTSSSVYFKAEATRAQTGGATTGQSEGEKESQSRRQSVAAMRSTRRRPSVGDVSQVAKRSDIAAETTDDEESGEDTQSLADQMTARLNKLKEGLTAVVKVKASFSSSEMRVTIDKYGEKLLLYAVEDKFQRKVVKEVPLERVTRSQVSAASPKTVEITVVNPNETHIFTFKSTQAAGKWLRNFEGLRKTKAMA